MTNVFSFKDKYGDWNSLWIPWSVLIVAGIIITIGIINYISADSIRERQIIADEWDYIKTKAGCNDLKLKLNELLSKKYSERTVGEEIMLDFIKEKYAWVCTSDQAVLDT